MNSLMRPEFGPLRLIFADRKTALSVSFDLFKNMTEWAVIYKGNDDSHKKKILNFSFCFSWHEIRNICSSH